MAARRQDPPWQQRVDQAWPDQGPSWSGGSGPPQWERRPPDDIRQYVQAIESAVDTLRGELAKARAEAATAAEQARGARDVAEEARSALEAVQTRFDAAQARLEEQASRLAEFEARRKEPAREPAPDAAAETSEPVSPSRRTPAGGGANRAPRHGDDPLADALTAFADELSVAAEARTRGELDAWEAIRLVRTGFHKTRRVLGALQREGRA